MHNNKSVRRVKQILSEKEIDQKIVYLPDSARTAKEAAEAIRCTIDQIAKSIVFIGKGTKRPYLVIASGPNRINEATMAKHVKEPIEMASAEQVRELTGFVIGGVAPVGHLEALSTYIDEDLFQHEKIWAAAGHPKAVLQLRPEELQALTEGQTVSVK